MGGGCSKCCWMSVCNTGTTDCSWSKSCSCVGAHVDYPCPSGFIDDGLFCRRPEESIGLSYVPSSYANTDRYNPSVKAKGSSIRGSTTPRCPDCQKEYSWVLGTCYDDCNITAGIASCVNGQVVKNAGKENLNYSMQSTGLCNLDCPSGYTDLGTYCAVKPENRGAGTALECSGRWQQYGLACYTPCNESADIAVWNGTTNTLDKRAGYEYVNYDMQSAGLCSQQCPAGAGDGGVFCARQSYSRGIGKPKS
jgi:hypothetical protein